MMPGKKSAIPVLLSVLLICIISFQGLAQPDSLAANSISKIMEQIKTSFELEKLNDCRIKLREVEYGHLKTQKEKEYYAEAYKQLAYAFRNHRYIRPGFEMYQKYISLRDTILGEEKAMQIAEMKKKQEILSTATGNEIMESEKEKNNLDEDKLSLDSLKKNNFRFSAVFTLALIGLFFFILSAYHKKLKAANSLLQSNRKRILGINDAVTLGQMSAGVFNRLKLLNSNIKDANNTAAAYLAAADKELKSIKESESSVKNIRDSISQIKQLCEISSKSIENVLQKIPLTKAYSGEKNKKS